MSHVALVWTAAAMVAALVAYVNHLAAKVQRLERVNQALLSGAAPSVEARRLAQVAGGRVEAMRIYRKETGAGIREAIAIVRTLASLGR